MVKTEDRVFLIVGLCRKVEISLVQYVLSDKKSDNPLKVILLPNLTKNNTVTEINFDLNKAYYGLHLNLIEPYLSYHKERRKRGTFFSRDRIRNTGVLKGSILGPLLFIIYSNDLDDLIPYADDTFIIISNLIETVNTLFLGVEKINL